MINQELNSALLSQTILFVFGTLLGGLAKGIFDRWTARTNLDTKISEKLQEDRFNSYIKIWKLSELLPSWPVNTDATYQDVLDLSIKMKNWYFEGNGMLMSLETRNKYGAIQETISHELSKNNDLSMKLGNSYEIIRSKFSDLRTSMTEDLQSRKRQFFNQ
ncbi:MAG: hypothetical protein ACK4NY_04890 [Spirosomataceae bacterium]